MNEGILAFSKPEGVADSTIQKKITPILEYLIYSGTPIYLTLKPKGKQAVQLPEPALLLDFLDETLLLEIPPSLTMNYSFPIPVEGTFGYKRKRASFTTKIVRFENNIATMDAPQHFLLINRRAHPRYPFEKPNKNLNVHLKAQTSLGTLEFSNVLLHELSQKGVSLYLDRSQGLLLPDDMIETFEIKKNNVTVFKTSGTVLRTNPHIQTPHFHSSYQAVILFQKPFRKTKRSGKNIPLLDAKPALFSAEHPLFPGKILKGQVFEISTTELVSIIESTPLSLLPGMVLPKCQLQLPGCSSKEFSLEVTHVQCHSDGVQNQFKMNGSIILMLQELQQEIMNYEKEVEGGFIEKVAQQDFELLYEFLFETNFIYQNQRELVLNLSKDIFANYHRLLSTQNPIAQKISQSVTVKADQIPFSALCFYDHTWLIQQHTIPSLKTPAPEEIASSLIEFIHRTNISKKNKSGYCLYFYDPEWLPSSILFEKTKEQIQDSLKCDLMNFTVGMVSGLLLKLKQKQIQLTIDTPESLKNLEDSFIQQNKTSWMRCFGLGQGSLQLNIQKEYKKLGLMRERHLVCAKKDDTTVFGLVELSTVGLNLSALTNSIFLFSEGANQDWVTALSEVVIDKAHELFFAPRNMFPMIIKPQDMKMPNNVNWTKNVCGWMLRMDCVDHFERASQIVLENFSEYFLQQSKKVML